MESLFSKHCKTYDEVLSDSVPGICDIDGQEDGNMIALSATRSLQQGHQVGEILFVDDESLILDEYKEALEFEGISCEVESDPHRALDLILANSEIRIVVTDHRMPGITGPELIRTLKSTLPTDRKLEFVLLSGYNEELGSEFDDVVQLIKPIDLKTLLSAIHHAC